MSFKDIKVAQVTYTAKDIVKNKKKHGRKYKNDPGKLEPELELELETELELEIMHIAKRIRKSTRRHIPKRTSITEADLLELMLEVELVKLTQDIPLVTWSVPVARIY
jgi:hypothetical protein